MVMSYLQQMNHCFNDVIGLQDISLFQLFHSWLFIITQLYMQLFRTIKTSSVFTVMDDQQQVQFHIYGNE